MLEVIVFIFVLGILVMFHEFGHFIAAKKSGVRVEQFSIGFGPKIYSFKKGTTEYRVSALPLGGYVKLAGDNYEEYKGAPDEYFSQPIYKRFWIIFSGPMLNYILGFVFFWVIFFVGYPAISNRVGEVMDGYGAQEAGIVSGDRIIFIENKDVKLWEEIQQVVQTNRSKTELKVGILRKGKVQFLSVKLKQTFMADNLGQKRSLGLLGIKPDFKEPVISRYGFFQAAYHGLEKMVNLTVITYKGMALMLGGKISLKESVTGPVGMFIITSEVTKLGIVALLHWVAVLSVSLGIFNLLPLPALDGGHIFLLLVEKIRGKSLKQKADEFFNRLGFGLIIFLALLIFYNDLSRYGFLDKITDVFKR